MMKPAAPAPQAPAGPVPQASRLDLLLVLVPTLLALLGAWSLLPGLVD